MTQVPLANTRVDLWRLVADHSVDGIVLLNDLGLEPPYWPTILKEPITFGPLSIELMKGLPMHI